MPDQPSQEIPKLLQDERFWQEQPITQARILSKFDNRFWDLSVKQPQVFKQFLEQHRPPPPQPPPPAVAGPAVQYKPPQNSFLGIMESLGKYMPAPFPDVLNPAHISTAPQVMRAPAQGVGEVVQGALQAKEPITQMGETRLGGVNQLASGAMKLGTPGLVASAVANPISTGLGLGAFTGAQAGTEKILDKFHVDKDVKEALSTLGGLIGGGITGLVAHGGTFGEQIRASELGKAHEAAALKGEAPKAAALAKGQEEIIKGVEKTQGQLLGVGTGAATAKPSKEQLQIDAIKKAKELFGKPSQQAGKKSILERPKEEAWKEALSVPEVASRLGIKPGDVKDLLGKEPPPTPKAITPQLTQQVKELYKNNLSPAEIAKQLGVEERNVRRVLPSTDATLRQIVPGLPAGIPNVVRRLADALNPDALKDTELTKAVIRQRGGELAANKERLYKVLDPVIKHWDTRPASDFLDFSRAIERGQTNTLGQIDNLTATLLDRMLEVRRQKIEQLSHGAFKTWFQNYFPHIWENPERVTQILGSRRPFEGTGAFKHRRSFGSIEEGINQGFVPIAWNAPKMYLMKIHEMDRYIMAHQTVDDLRVYGLIKYTKGKAPQGWDRLDDKIFKPQVPLPGGGVASYGQYYAPRDVARIVNNFLAPGLRGEPNPWKRLPYTALRVTGNMLNRTQLAVGTFHAGFTTMDSMTSQVALGLQKVLNAGPLSRRISGLKDILTFPVAPITTAFKGNRMLAEYMEPGTYRRYTNLVDAAIKGGHRVALDPYYKNNGIERFWNGIKMARDPSFPIEKRFGAGFKSLFSSIDALTEYLAKPVMEMWVPRIKLGVMSRMLEDASARGIRENWSPELYRQEYTKVVDSVDNRLGQLAYDNLLGPMWDKKVKDLGLVLVRSLGWNIGTMREIGGGIKDISKLLSSDKEVSYRLAYAAALPMTIAATGTLIHFLHTGKMPPDLYSTFHIPTGRVGPDGRPETLDLPSYMKDIFAFYEQGPGKTGLNKLNPIITALVEMYSNKDFYGTEITHPGDPKTARAVEWMKWAEEQFLPLSIRNYQRFKEEGTPLATALTAAVGVSPTPAYVGLSPAMRLASEYASRHYAQGPHTAGDFERMKVRREIAGRFRQQELPKAEKLAKLRPADISAVEEKFSKGILQQRMKSLSLEEAIEVGLKASKEELPVVGEIIAEKMPQLFNRTPDEQPPILKKYSEFTQHAQSLQQSSDEGSDRKVRSISPPAGPQ